MKRDQLQTRFEDLDRAGSDAPYGFDQTSMMDTLLAFGMGRIARSTKEVILIGTWGRTLGALKSRSERDVFFSPSTKHSKKPEELQDKIERLFPGPYLELFARREREGWTCVGNECPGSEGQDIKDSLAVICEHQAERVDDHAKT